MFPTRSDTNRAAQPQKMARSLKFGFRKKRGRTIRGADQLRSYCAADLRLCFRICKKAGFLVTRIRLCSLIVLKEFIEGPRSVIIKSHSIS